MDDRSDICRDLTGLADVSRTQGHPPHENMAALLPRNVPSPYVLLRLTTRGCPPGTLSFAQQQA